MKIEGDYAIIETLEAAAAVFGTEKIEDLLIGTQALINRTYVLEAITPKEGDAVFIVRKQMAGSQSPEYFINWTPRFTGPTELVFACNAITKNQDCKQLRDLHAWCKP